MYITRRRRRATIVKARQLGFTRIHTYRTTGVDIDGVWPTLSPRFRYAHMKVS